MDWYVCCQTVKAAPAPANEVMPPPPNEIMPPPSTEVMEAAAATAADMAERAVEVGKKKRERERQKCDTI